MTKANFAAWQPDLRLPTGKIDKHGRDLLMAAPSIATLFAAAVVFCKLPH